MFKKLSLVFALFFFSTISSQAQFKHLLHKAEKKVEQAISKKDSSKAQKKIEPTAKPATETQKEKQDKSESPPKPKPIVFPHTGQTTKAMHAVFAPVLDGDIKKITNTPEGKYALDLARKKGLKGNDMDVFRQLLQPKNKSLMDEISAEVKKKFPHAKNKTQHVSGNFNPAHGGFSAPSFYFKFMLGEFDVWMTNRYVKWASKHEHVTMADAFGVNVVSITDLQKRMAYNIGSVFGVNYTKVTSLDSVNRPYGPLAVMPLFKKQYQGIKGIKVEQGKPEKFGKYNCSVVKIIIPVRPYRDKDTHKINRSLLSLHDILSGRDDAVANDGKGHWDPSYKIIYKGYFSHDIDKDLPAAVRERVRHLKWKKGIGVGAAIADEKGNSADFRLIDVTTDNDIDTGQFQVPKGYPVMTDEEVQKAIRKKIGLDMKHNLLKGLKDQVEGNHE